MGIERLITRPTRYMNISPYCIPNPALKCRPAETPQTLLSFSTLPQTTGEVSCILPPLLLSTSDVLLPYFPPSPLPLDFTPSPQCKFNSLPLSPNFSFPMSEFFCSSFTETVLPPPPSHYTDVRNKLLNIMFKSVSE